MRYDYEHTDRTIPDICAEHGISSGTLRDRMRRWRWTRRRMPIPFEGPPAVPGPFAGTAAVRAADRPDGAERNPRDIPEAISPPGFAALHPGYVDPLPAAPDDRPIALRLQSAIDRVLPAIEATVGRLGTPAMHPREMERGARALASLTRTLRELTGLLSERQAAADDDDDGMPKDMDAFRAELARRIEAFVASRRDAEAAEAERQSAHAAQPEG